MTEDKTIINLMKNNISGLKKGTLRFLGEWFGRPMDNYHIIVDVQFNQQGNTLMIKFNEGETLTVWNPANINSNSNEFYIKSATKIKWEWFSYGQPQINYTCQFSSCGYYNCYCH